MWCIIGCTRDVTPPLCVSLLLLPSRSKDAPPLLAAPLLALLQRLCACARCSSIALAGSARGGGVSALEIPVEMCVYYSWMKDWAMAESTMYNGCLCYDAVKGRGLCVLVSPPTLVGAYAEVREVLRRGFVAQGRSQSRAEKGVD
jgi:hypothetical protein